MKQLAANQLALYLGCEVAVTQMQEPFYPFDLGEKGLKLVGVIGNRIVIRRIAEDVFDTFNQCKLVLRPLTDITEEEKKELYSLVFNRPFVGDNITHRDIGKKEERWVLWSGLERLFIYKDGDIGADSDLSHYRVPAPIILQWQLSKHFDLFNYIENGLALDKTKI